MIVLGGDFPLGEAVIRNEKIYFNTTDYRIVSGGDTDDIETININDIEKIEIGSFEKERNWGETIGVAIAILVGAVVFGFLLLSISIGFAIGIVAFCIILIMGVGTLKIVNTKIYMKNGKRILATTTKEKAETIEAKIF